MDQGELASLDPGRGDPLHLQTGRFDSVEYRADPFRTFRMTAPGVVEEGGRMARNYDVHPLTLAQVPTLVRVEGEWPDPITLSSGWFRARARPWNDEVSEPMIRLDRGGAEFLVAVTRRVHEVGGEVCYSPALFGGTSRVWLRSRYQPHATLRIMERGLNPVPSVAKDLEVTQVTDPDWEAILQVDRASFEGFWAMSRDGLVEALMTNRAHVLLEVRQNDEVAGYAIVGSQWGVAYLHRIAVHPDWTGRGLGRALLGEAVRWGSVNGGRTMILNVRPENQRAITLYERTGFTDTGTELTVLRHQTG